jgi:transposase-like protein
MAGRSQGGLSKRVSDRYASMRTRAHWKPEDAARVLDDWSRSGLPLAAFAREHGLRYERLQRWQARLRESSPQAVRLVPVMPRKAPLIELASIARAAAVVVAVEGVRVEVTTPSEVDPRWVVALVHGLQGEPT